MKILNREIRPEQVNMWVNVISFLIGILFYIRVEHKMRLNSHLALPSSEQTQILQVQSNLQTQLSNLKIKQDSIIAELKQQKISIQQFDITRLSITEKINAILSDDWNHLSKSQKDKYIQLLTQPYNKNKTE